MKKTIIVALARGNAIGRGNELLVHLRGDLRRFKEVTMGHPMIMGRNTFLSIGKPLPGRTSIVVTSNPDAFREAHPEFFTSGNAQAPAAPSDSLKNLSPVAGSNGGADFHLVAVSSLQEAFEEAAKALGGEICFITGGASIYSQCINLVDELDITRIDASFADADAFFPAIDGKVWKLHEAAEPLEEIPRGSFSAVKFRFERWIRK